jgi:hypothetical protein
MITKPDWWTPLHDFCEEHGFTEAQALIDKHCAPTVAEVVPLAAAWLRKIGNLDHSFRHGMVNEENVRRHTRAFDLDGDMDGAHLCDLLLAMPEKRRRKVARQARQVVEEERLRDRDEVTGRAQPMLRPSSGSPTAGVDARPDPWRDFRFPDPMPTHLTVDGEALRVNDHGRDNRAVPFVDCIVRRSGVEYFRRLSGHQLATVIAENYGFELAGARACAPSSITTP